MAKVLSSISGNLISAASAGYAPTNSADVSAIASAYQVVSATGTQLYAGTAHVTSLNSAPISASRAGNAANASLANSAWYDGTGRLISALPDSATVSAIASSYAKSSVSGVEATVSANSASWAGGGTALPIEGTYINISDDYGVEVSASDGQNTASYNSRGITISGLGDSAFTTIHPDAITLSDSADWASFGHADVQKWNSAVDTVSANSASWGGGATGDYVETSATEVAIGSDNSASSYSFAQGSQNSAYYNSFAQGRSNSADNNSFAQGSSNSAYNNSFAHGSNNSAYNYSFAQGYYNSAANGSFAQGQRISARNTAAVFGKLNLRGNGSTSTGDSAAFVIGDGTATGARHDLMVVTKDGEITMFSSTADTTGTGIMSAIRAISAAATGASVSLPITGSAGSDSATYAATSVELVRNDTAGEPDIRTAHMSPDQFQINYTYNNQDYTSMLLNENMLEFDDADGAHIVDAYSIDTWNSAVDTVANNSASWGGGATGDYVEKSSLNTTIGSSNNAFGLGLAHGISASAGNRGYAFGQDISANDDSLACGSACTAVYGSFAHGTHASAYLESFADGWYVTARNSATAFGQFNRRGNGSTALETGSAAFVIGDGTSDLSRHDLMLVTKDGEITVYSSTADTVGLGLVSSIKAISANAGGPVTATASATAKMFTSTGAAASSFTGISSVNGSALLVSNMLPNAQQANGNAHFHYMPTTSPWGSTEYTGLLSPLQYATGAALAMKQSDQYGAYYKGNEWFLSDVGTNTAANGVVRAELHRTRGIHLYGSSLNSATGFHLNGSGVDGQSGASSWQYGPTEYNMLIDVNDTVSSQSANWGGSALALSAGPGVSLTKSGNTLVASTDETVLWSGETTSITGITLNESYAHFDRVRFYWNPWNDPMSWQVTDIPGIVSYINLSCGWANNSQRAFFVYEFSSTDKLNFSQVNGAFSNITSTAWTTATACKVYKVVGVNRTAGV